RAERPRPRRSRRAHRGGLAAPRRPGGGLPRAPAHAGPRPRRAGGLRPRIGAGVPPISRGFGARRRRPEVDPARVPPGQYVVHDFPVLSAGPTPHPPVDEGSLTIDGAVDEALSWSWDEFLALPSETFTVDIHCVTKWSKLDTTWTGVSVDTLLEDVSTEAEYLTAWGDGGYTTNLALE